MQAVDNILWRLVVYIGLSRATVDVAGQTLDRLRLIGFCSGVQIKTRKRNIAVALDPGSFAEAVVTIFEDQKDGDDLEKNLLAGVKVQQLSALCWQSTHAILLIAAFAGRPHLSVRACACTHQLQKA